MSIRDEAHDLIDRLADDDLAVVVRMLRGLLAAAYDPVQSALGSAPLDDEPYTDAEQAEDEAALTEYQRGRFVTHEEVLGRLGRPGG